MSSSVTIVFEVRPSGNTTGMKSRWFASFVTLGTLAVVIIAASLAGSGAVLDNNRYVSPTGSDAALGGSDSPWKSFCKAIDRLQPGQTLIVRDGVYRENCTQWNGTTKGPVSLTPGTLAAPVRVEAAAGANPVVEGLVWIRAMDYWTFSNIDVRWSNTQLPPSVIVDTMTQSQPAYTPTPTDHMVRLQDGTGWTWENSEISGAESYANILVGSVQSGRPANWTLRGNCIHDTDPDANNNSDDQNHNIYVNGKSSNGAGLITRNILFNAPNGENIKLAGGASPEGTNSVTISYNTMYHAKKNVLIGWSSKGNILERNLMVDAISTNKVLRAYQLTGSGNVARYNYWFDDQSSMQAPDNFPYLSVSESNNVKGDPKFDSVTSCSGFKPQTAAAQAYGAFAP